MDKDTSATNFMVRDRLMEAVVNREHEPITPFVERVRDLWERSQISSVIVAGSSGAFFTVADVVLQHDTYQVYDITEHAHTVCSRLNVSVTPRAATYELPAFQHYCTLTLKPDARGPRIKLQGMDFVWKGHRSICVLSSSLLIMNKLPLLLPVFVRHIRRDFVMDRTQWMKLCAHSICTSPARVSKRSVSTN